jgi:hypothetical protein
MLANNYFYLMYVEYERCTVVNGMASTVGCSLYLAILV